MNKSIFSLPELDGIANFSPAAWLHVTGEDALSFLQGQFTQELREGRAPAVSHGLWLSPKGKVLADSWVLRASETEAWIWSAGSSAAVIRERLEAFIIADDVMIEDFTAQVAGRVLLGVEGRRQLEAEGITPPAMGEWVGGAGGWIFGTRRGVAESWEWVGPAEANGATKWEPTLDAVAVERARIAGGVVAVPADFGPDDLPNEGGMEAQSISYTKGCYLGQEVVARLKALGRARRRLIRVMGYGPLPEAGDRGLWAGDTKVGELRSMVAVDEGWMGWAMVKVGREESGWNTSCGQTVQSCE